jgi:hypothetical protein
MAFVLAAFDDSLDSRDLSHDTIQPRREQPHVRFTAESTPRAVRLCHHSAQPVCSIIAVVFDLALNGTIRKREPQIPPNWDFHNWKPKIFSVSEPEFLIQLMLLFVFSRK